MPFGRRGPLASGLPGRSGNSPLRAAGHPQVIHQVVAEDAARVRQAVGVARRRRVEQDAGGLERLGAQHDGLRVDLANLTGHAVDVDHPARLVGLVVHQHLVDHRVRDVRGASRLDRVGDGGECGVEVRVRLAAALARAAEVTGGAAVDRLRQVGDAADRQRASELRLDRVARVLLGAGERHRRQEAAVGELRQVLGQTRDADVVLDEIVVGLEVLVVERPVDAVAVERGALHVLLAEAIALAAPHVGAPAGDAHAALPREGLAGRGRVRLLEVVAEPVRVVLGAGVAVLLRRLRATNQIVGARAELQVVGGLVLGVVDVLQRAPGAHQRDAQAGLRHPLGGPSPRRTRSDNDDVELLRPGLYLHGNLS